MTEDRPLEIGWEEWVALPDLGVPAIKAKIDTGARTSSLHAFSIEPFGSETRPKVRFGIHPVPDRPDIVLYGSAPVVDRREIVSSNGETELRYIIRTTLRIGERSWPIEVSLAGRESMSYRMLVGRTALPPDVVINPQGSCLCGSPPPDIYDQHAPEPTSRELKIGILSRESENFSTRRLVEAAESRGHLVEVINTTRCYMNITSHNPEVYLGRRKLTGYDAIIPRIGASVTFYGLAVVRQFEMMGVYCVNSSVAIGASRDKLFAHQLLARSGIGMPVTTFAHSPDDSASLIRLCGGSPVVIKLLEGTQGRGVVLADSEKAAESVIGAIRGLRANLLVQEYIREAAGADIRCFVIGNKVVAAMKRQAPEGEFRSNLHRGGSATRIRISRTERETAVRAAKVMGLNVAGVDLLRTSTGPRVLEVNSSPGLEGIEKATGKDIAGDIIALIEKHARPLPRRPAGRARRARIKP